MSIKKIVVSASLFAGMMLLVSLLAVGCGNDDGGNDDDVIVPPSFEGLTLDNYPKVDGSTSTKPLNAIIACKLLGIDYEWEWGQNPERYVKPELDADDSDKFSERIKSSQTHQSFINLIDKEANLILSARKMSPDEKDYAAAAGVNLIETPIALDAFVFIVNEENPVNSLTIKQVQDIYTGVISNWQKVGGDDAEIVPFVRNANSGSQELMETMVMKDLNITEFPVNEYEMIGAMMAALDSVSHNQKSICYTIFYYMEHIASGTRAIKRIGIDGILPDTQTIASIEIL